MNILYIVPYAPNLIRIRPYNLIRSLDARGNQVTVLTLCTDDADRASVREMEASGIPIHALDLTKRQSLLNAVRAAFTHDPLQSFYSWQPRLAEAALQMIDDQQSCRRTPAFDVVHVEHLRGARFGFYLASHQRSDRASRSIPIVWDSVDSITYLFKQAARQSKKLISRWITRFELSRTPGFERRAASLFERTIVTSPVDRQAFLDLLPSTFDPSRIQVLPNGVDLEYFHPDPSVEREPATLVVSGKMSYHANVTMTLHLVDAILPKVWSQKPDVRLLVVGKDPPREIRALEQDPRIQVSGYVPDIRPYLQKATLAVAPLTYGAGIQNKVLEAMACGVPVVTTPLASRNTQAKPGSDLLVAQEPADFADAVIDLLNHPERCRQVGAAGRRYVETCHNWQAIAGCLENIYREAAKAYRQTD